jgi:hypothetical protein
MSEIILEEISETIGRAAGKTGQSVRFHALRLMFEVIHGRKLTVPEQKRLYNKALGWTPDRDY